MLARNQIDKYSKDTSFYSNPYFDEIFIFFKKELITSHDTFKPFTCLECEKELYKKGNKKNKTDFVNEIREMLLKNKNVDWPFKDNLLVQYYVSDTPSKIISIDLDNLAKTIFDCFESVVYLNDNQIHALLGSKLVIGNFSSFIIAIRKLNKNETPIFQQFLYSVGEDIYLKERETENLKGRYTRMISFE